MVAAIIDVLIVFVLLLLALGVLRGGRATSSRTIRSSSPIPASVWSSVALQFVILVAVLTVAWSGSGPHPRRQPSSGCACSPNRGTGPRWRRALLRALVVVYIPVVSMLWILVSRKNAGMHDLVCRTTVIYDWRAHRVSESRPPE